MGLKHDLKIKPSPHLYDKMDEEVPKNETEREILKRMAAGISLLDCKSFAVQYGYTEEAFETLLERAKQWENENCSRYSMPAMHG